ncbi:MAG: ABC transporter permease subunit [Ruminiclostridium sp.]|nr:ABC transporter permease subunit [Ruminiclostridium sp.]
MRKNTKKVDIIIIAVLLLLIAGGILLALLPQKEQQAEKSAAASAGSSGSISYKDYIGKRVGIVTGSSLEKPTFTFLPDSEYFYYDTLSDLILALKQNKIDCFMYDEPILRMIHIEQPEIGYLSDMLKKEDYSFAFQKNSEKADVLIGQFNEMLSEFGSDGTLKKMEDKWFSAGSEKNRVDFSGLDDTNGTLNIVTISTNVPFSMISDGELTGYSIELVEKFCRRYGYDCNFDQTGVASAIAGISAGHYDILAACATVTEERKESMNFSDPIYTGGIALAVSASDIAQSYYTVTEDTPLSYFADKKIGILTGSAYEPVVKRIFPNAAYVYYDLVSDLALATVSGKIDGYLMSIEQATTMKAENPTLFWLKEAADEVPYAFAFPKTEKGAALRDKINEFIAKLRADGTLDTLLDKWTKGNIEQSVDLTGFSGENGTLNIACTGTIPPYEFAYNGMLTGYEIELVAMFCREYGYNPSFSVMTFAGVVPGIASGKYDMAAANLTVTEERAESVYFSDKQSGSTIVMVTASDGNAGTNDSAVEDRPFSYYAENKKIGVITASLYEGMINERFPGADLYQFNNQADLGVALDSGVIDSFIVPKATAEEFVKQYDSMTMLKEVFTKVPYGFAFERSADKEYLRDQMNDFLEKIRADGTYDELVSVWFGDDEDKKVVDTSGLTGENGTLNLITTATMQPYSYIKDGENVGFEIDIATRYCREYGYALNISTAEFSAMIPAVTSGMVDIACANIMITKERAESVNFSDPYYTTDAIPVVKKETDTNEAKLVPAVTLDELNSPDRTVGVWTGASGMLAVEKYLPEAKELMYESLTAALEAVRAGQIDAFVFERRQLQIAVDSGISGVMLLDDNLGESIDVAIGLSRVTKVSGLEDSINRFIAEKNADGTLDDMFRRWAVDKNYTMPEIEPAASPEFTLVVGTTGTVEPYSFYYEKELTGYDVEMARRFAAWLGADIEFKVIDYSGIIAAAQSGSIDCIFANLNITDERREAIDFSDPIYPIENGILVRAVSVQETEPEQSWLDSIVLSFEKNFIREDRWKLIVEGIVTTCIITVMSAIFGSVLAFLVCMFRRTGSRLANVISNIYVKLLQGTPIVVLLMILYYVVLGKSGLDAAWVAVIGFTLNFGAYASEIMRSGIESIDAGQREAALALGYNENQAFFKFIFPQAAVRFLPVYRGEIVSLLKSTSIVGYIAIQDLTKMSDIIRSRTYEAFFPLIATAIIYFILAWIISLILKLILKGIDKRSRKRGALK